MISWKLLESYNLWVSKGSSSLFFMLIGGGNKRPKIRE